MKVTKLRLSPNEEAQLIQQEHERRRKLRIQQVREQQRYIAQRIRQEVEQRRHHELELLEEELRAEWELQQGERVNKLHMLYQESLSLLGQGHRCAKENELNLTAIHKKEDNVSKAEERYRKALKELNLQRLKDHENQSRSVNARKKALQTEKLRSANVASLALPPPWPHQDIGSKLQHAVKKCDASAFAATHYHMPDTLVDKEMAESQPNAHTEAELEVERQQDKKREEDQKKEEQLEKARLRGRQALRKEQLVQDHERLLDELEHMQQRDLFRRRQQVCNMPRKIFEPLYKRKEMEEDFQREMEFAFEDMYTGERRVKGDLLIQLVPEPLPTPSTGSQDQDLDITQDELLPSENTGPAGAGPAPRRALKRLLDRIQKQRQQWTSPTISTDCTPKRDTSIDTGSLSSVERDKHLFESKQASAADINHSNALAKPIQEFEDQMEKEGELEREKQMVVLQEMEYQKVKLEQRLLEARQERELLKAAVTEKVPSDPAHNQPVPLVGDPIKRKDEYRLRLLWQNKTHQRSVAGARQRLEEYQSASRFRYNSASVLLQGFYDSSGHSFEPAVQVQPSEPVKTQEKTHISVAGPTMENNTLHPPYCPLGLDVAFDLQTLPAKPHIMGSLQNLPQCVTTEISSDVPTTNISIQSSSNPNPVINLSVEEGMERHGLQDVWLKQQTENVGLQQQQEPERQGIEQQQKQKEEMEQIKLQKSTLKALISTDAQVSQEMIQARCKLLKSLLKALEKSNGGTLHLEYPQHQPSTSGFSSGLSTANMPPSAATKPPVTRVKLCAMVTQQHQLSVIEEVQTPANLSLVTGQEGILAVNQDTQQKSESSLVKALTIQTNSEAHNPVLWREGFLRTGTTTGSSTSGLAQLIISRLPSDTGRGADYSGPVATGSDSPVEHVHRLHDADCLSSTISTGSYITTDLEQKSELGSIAEAPCPTDVAKNLKMQPTSALYSFLRGNKS